MLIVNSSKIINEVLILHKVVLCLVLYKVELVKS